MQISKFFSGAILAAVMAILGGCATPKFQEISKAATSTAALAHESFKQGATIPQPRPIATESDKFWVPKLAVKVKDDGLPELFRKPMGVSFLAKSSLRDATDVLARNAGVRFSFSADVTSESDKPLLMAEYSAKSDLKGFLDVITSIPNPAMSWQYKDGQVEIYRYVTRVIPLRIPTQGTVFTAEITDKSQSSGSAAGGQTSGQNVKMESKIDAWESIEKVVNQMLTPGIGHAVVARALQTVTITDLPQAVNLIESNLKQLNETTLRGVFLRVQVVTVKNTAGDNYALNWNSIVEQMSSKYGLALSGKSAALPAGFPEGAGTLNAIFQAKGQADPTTALMSVLSSMGKQAEAATYPVWARSGVPNHTAVNQDTGYVSAVTVTQPTVAGGAPTQALTSSTVTAGVSLHTMVQVIDSNTISLEQNINISTLDGLKPFGSATSGQLQLAEQSRVALGPMTTLKSGETMMIGGMEKLESRANQTGMGSAENQLLVGSTGSRVGSNTQTKIVVLITPYIL